MQNNTELILKKKVKFVKPSDANESAAGKDSPSSALDDLLGGIVKWGQLGWHAKGSSFTIFSQKTGHSITQFCFDANLGLDNCIITCMCEIDIHIPSGCLMAIGVQYGDSPGGLIAVFSVQDSRILRCIEIKEKITCCHFVNTEISKRTVLDIMQGCLAIGTDTGNVLLCDLNLKKCEEAYLNYNSNFDDVKLVPCHVIESSIDLHHIRQHYSHPQQEDINVAIQLEEIQNTGLVLCLQSVTPMLSLIVGVEDGRMLIYDLSDMQLFIVINPSQRLSPLVKCSFIEPPDDPKPCIYIWALHENSHCSVAVMHSFLYNRKCVEEDGIALLEDFEKSTIRLVLPMFERSCIPVSCQAVTKQLTNGDEDTISLCLMTWKIKDRLEIMVFDINQWYKEEMPPEGNWKDNLSYLASFNLKDSHPLDVCIDPNTIALFNSIQRPEEHFYPVALSFDCVVLESSNCLYLHWPGLQNRAINMLNCGGPLAILEPSTCFSEIITASLLPQFCEHNYSATFSINTQREILLSVAIEYNCVGLLKECAKHWADGSHLGRHVTEGLSLSTLTEWIWKRAGTIKNRCNFLSTSLFNFSGCSLGQREQKEMTLLSRQLKLLGNLLELIITKWSINIPRDALDVLHTQNNSIRMSSEYQEVLLWLLNIGLLPEAKPNSLETNLNLVPYPYTFMKKFYDSQRKSFKELNDNFINHRTKSCRILFIDSFIEHECNPNILRDYWQESGGNGLYPPPSLQAMLRTLLIPDVSFQKKCALFLYFFLDLNNAIDDDKYAEIVQSFIKFPTVFKLPASIIKTVQSFWYLDHGQFQVAVEEVMSPFYRDQKLNQWQLELLIASLLAQNQPHYALRALQVAKSQISPVLELKTLLVNDLIPEAFHFARSRKNIEIMKVFFSGCLYMNKYSVLRDLAFTEEEGKLIIDLLNEQKSTQTDNLHLVYLLQKCKYIEAITYLDILSKRRANIDTPSLVLSAYNMTMTPMAKDLSDSYYKIKNRIKDKELQNIEPLPLSSQLIKENANSLLGGIYQSSALGAHYATYYWDETESEPSNMRSARNAPFVRRPQEDILSDGVLVEEVSYPEPYKSAPKRNIKEASIDRDLEKHWLENPRKRRKINENSNELIAHYKNACNNSSRTMLSQVRTKPVNDYTLNDQSNVEQSLKTSKKQSSLLLSTPFVKDIHIDSIENSYADQTDKANTLTGILKGSASRLGMRDSCVNEDKLNISEGSCRNESVDDDKSIRFDLPIVNDALEEEIVEPIESAQQTLHSADSSILSYTTNDNDFFSPLSSRDNSKYLDTQETQITTDIQATTKIEKHISKDSAVEMSTLYENSSSLTRRTDGAKPRRPIRSGSESSYDLRRSSSRSRSNTPEIEIKPKPQPVNAQLSRRVLEANMFAKKASTDLEQEHMPEVVTKIDTNNFKPFISSSKITDNVTKFVEKTVLDKFSERSTVIGGVTFNETYSKLITSSSTYSTSSLQNKPEQINSNRMMDTTVDMTMGDITAFGPSANNLAADESLDEKISSEVIETEELRSFGGPCEEDIYSSSESVIMFMPLVNEEEEADERFKDTLKNKFLDIVSKIDEDDVDENSPNVESEVSSEEENIAEEQEDEEEFVTNRNEDTQSSSGSTSSKILIEDDSNSVYDNTDDETEENMNEEEEQVAIDTESEDDDVDGEEATDNDDNIDAVSVKTISSSNSSVSGSINKSDSSSNENSCDQLNYVPSDIGLGKIEATSTMMSQLDYGKVQESEVEDSVCQSVITIDSEDECIVEESDYVPEEEVLNSVTAVDEKPAEGNVEEGIESETVDSEDECVVEESDYVPEEEGLNRVTEVDEKPSEGNVEEDIQSETKTADECFEGMVSTETTEQEKNSSEIVPIEKHTELEGAKKNIEADNSEVISNEINILEIPQTIETTAEAVPAIADVIEKSENTSQVTPTVEIKSTATMDSTLASDGENPTPMEENIIISSVTADESQDIKLVVSDSESIIEESTTPTTRVLRARRSKSFLIEKDEITPSITHSPSVQRSLRGASVPKTISSDSQTKLNKSKSLSSDALTPSRTTTRSRLTTMDRIEENAVLDSPALRLRTRKRLDSTESDSGTPSVSAKKRTRLSSITETPDGVTTPRRARGKSLEPSAEVATTPRPSRRRSTTVEEVTITPRTLRRRSTTAEEVNDTPRRSTRRLSTTSNREPSIELSPQAKKYTTTDKIDTLPTTPRSVRRSSTTSDEVSVIPRRTSRQTSVAKESPPTNTEVSMADLLATSRRLTRTQLAVLEKAMSSNPGASTSLDTLAPPKKQSGKQSEVSPQKSEKDSDTESVASKMSLRSNTSGSRRVTRRSAQKEDNDDTISIASSTKSTTRRKRAAASKADSTSPETNLQAIPEEVQEETDSESVRSSHSGTPASKRTKTRRQKK